MFGPGSGTRPLAAESPDQIISAGAARIAGESLRAWPPPAIQGARSRQEDETTPVSAHTGADPAPTPPDGYSFAEHSGDMANAPIKRRSGEGPEDEAPPDWLDPRGAVSDLARQAESAGRDWSFGWIRLAADSRPAELAQALEGTNAEILGASGRMIRARLPRDAAYLETIASLDAVDGIGATPRNAKLAGFADDPLGETPVYVTLLPDDPDGRWHRAMENLGAVVGGYDRALRVYRANASPDVIEALASADFVLAVEPIPLTRPATTPQSPPWARTPFGRTKARRESSPVPPARRCQSL